MLPFDADTTVTVHNTSPQMTGTTGTAHVRMIADVTISAGGCYNP